MKPTSLYVKHVKHKDIKFSFIMVKMYVKPATASMVCKNFCGLQKLPYRLMGALAPLLPEHRELTEMNMIII